MSIESNITFKIVLKKIIKNFPVIKQLLNRYWTLINLLSEIKKQNLSQTARLSEIEKQNLSQTARLSEIKKQNLFQTARLSEIEKQNIAQTARLNEIEKQNVSQITSLSEIEKQNFAFKKSIDVLTTRLNEIEKKNEDFMDKLSNYESVMIFLSASLSSRCPICGGDHFSLFGNNPDFENSCVLKCKNCSFSYTYTFRCFDAFDYYSKEYREVRHETVSEKYLSFQDERASAQYDFIESTIRNKLSELKVLEIGCGCGRLLKKFEGASIITGYEPDVLFANFANKDIENAIIVNESFKEEKIESNSIDIILLSHVFEHFNDPNVILRDLYRVLKKDGKLFIEVPNENDKSINYMIKFQKGVGHFAFYNPDSLTKILEENGFFIEKLGTFTATLDDYNNSLWYKIPSERNMAKEFVDGIHIRCIARKHYG